MLDRIDNSRTRGELLAWLTEAFEAALRRGLIGENPARRVRVVYTSNQPLHEDDEAILEDDDDEVRTLLIECEE